MVQCKIYNICFSIMICNEHDNVAFCEIRAFIYIRVSCDFQYSIISLILFMNIFNMLFILHGMWRGMSLPLEINLL